MNKFITSVFYLLLAFFFIIPEKSSAIGVDFTERAYFYPNGSGLFSLRVDLTKSRHLISIIKYLNKDYGQITKLIGYNTFVLAKQSLKTMRDISDIRIHHDQNMLVCTLRFAFKNVKALNRVMQKINEKLDVKDLTYFSLNDELFIREDVHGILKKIMHYHQYDNSLIKSLSLSSFFHNSTYTTVYTFPHPIRHASNPFSQLTKDKKTIRIIHHILSTDHLRHSIMNRVHFDTDAHIA